jgi:hypothetical protein
VRPGGSWLKEPLRSRRAARWSILQRSRGRSASGSHTGGPELFERRKPNGHIDVERTYVRFPGMVSCMDVALADIVKRLGDGFAELAEHVSAHGPSADGVIAVRRLVDTAEHVCTQTVSQFAAVTDFTHLGHRDVGSWLAAASGARRTEGLVRVRQANVLELLPLVAEAAQRGEFSSAHLRCLSAAITAPRQSLAVRDQHVFVHSAAALDASQFALVVQRWVSLADDELSDPEHVDGRDEEAVRLRRLQLTRQLNGSWRLTGVFDPLAGEAIDAVLAAVTPRPSTDDVRSPAQRKADGFIDMCREYLARDDRPCVGNERPNVNIVMHAADGAAHTSSGWFVRNWQLSQVLCDATVSAVAATLKGIPFDVGTPLTAIPARNRRAIVTRDRCCRFPHCSRPARWCEIHHIRERDNGGTHELSNLVLLCTYHHREVHRRGITLVWNGPELVATLRNGITLHGPPHPTSLPCVEHSG